MKEDMFHTESRRAINLVAGTLTFLSGNLLMFYRDENGSYRLLSHNLFSSGCIMLCAHIIALFLIFYVIYPK